MRQIIAVLAAVLIVNALLINAYTTRGNNNRRAVNLFKRDEIKEVSQQTSSINAQGSAGAQPRNVFGINLFSKSSVSGIAIAAISLGVLGFFSTSWALTSTLFVAAGVLAAIAVVVKVLWNHRPVWARGSRIPSRFWGSGTTRAPPTPKTTVPKASDSTKTPQTPSQGEASKVEPLEGSDNKPLQVPKEGTDGKKLPQVPAVTVSTKGSDNKPPQDPAATVPKKRSEEELRMVEPHQVIVLNPNDQGSDNKPPQGPAATVSKERSEEELRMVEPHQVIVLNPNDQGSGDAQAPQNPAQEAPKDEAHKTLESVVHVQKNKDAKGYDVILSVPGLSEEEDNLQNELHQEEQVRQNRPADEIVTPETRTPEAEPPKNDASDSNEGQLKPETETPGDVESAANPLQVLESNNEHTSPYSQENVTPKPPASESVSSATHQTSPLGDGIDHGLGSHSNFGHESGSSNMGTLKSN